MHGMERGTSTMRYLSWGNGRTSENVYTASSFKHGKNLAEPVIFLPAFSSCDTTPIIRMGKETFMNSDTLT